MLWEGRMSRQQSFYKMQNGGNDFVILQLSKGKVPSKETLQWICHRKRGIGADTVIVLSGMTSRQRGGGSWGLRFFNADGGEAEACGNGLCCVGLRRFLETQEREGSFHTQVGERVYRVKEGGSVEVFMGRATGKESALEDIIGKQLVEYQSIYEIFMGNPHIVVLLKRFFPQEEVMEEIFQLLQERVSGGVNVGFCLVRKEGLLGRVWERGVGCVESCGTGACAMVAAYGREESEGGVKGRYLPVIFQNEQLQVRLTKEEEFWLLGTPKDVFCGSVDYHRIW